LKNIDHVIKKTAAEMNLPEDKVKIVIDKYWRTLYDKMVNGMDDDKCTLFLRNIGLFTVSRFKLNNFIKKKINKIKGMENSKKYDEHQKKEFFERHKKKLSLSLKYRNLVAKSYAKYYDNI
jgi:hypothetical protein